MKDSRDVHLMSKKQENKYDPSFISMELVKAIAMVRTYGVEKHGNRDNWKTTEPNEHFRSAMRHLLAAMNGYPYDKDSGLPHIAMCITNLMFELERKNFYFNREAETEKEQFRYDKRDQETIIIK